jgi:hypothetical protein
MAARVPIDYVAELGQARAMELVQRKYRDCRVEPTTRCWIFSGSSNTDGYGQVTARKNSDIRARNKARPAAFTLHRVAYLSRHGRNIVGHCSHLCDVRACFNPDHLVDESAANNNARKGCIGPIYCPDHGELIVNPCPHTPTCVRPPRSDVKCCATRFSEARTAGGFDTLMSDEPEASGFYSSSSPVRALSRRPSAAAAAPLPEVAVEQPLGSRTILTSDPFEFPGSDDLRAALEDPEFVALVDGK